jgi:hypothetical protein
MPVEGFPADPEPLRATLLRALELKGHTGEYELVRAAEIDITHEGHDNWNGGIDFYALNFRVPLELFVKHERHLKEREESILQTAKALWRGQPAQDITSVVVYPASLTAHGTTQSATAFNTPLPPFWTPGQFRLFLTHCASYKAEVTHLRAALAPLGVSAFVAHTDIEPTKEWEREIERGLQTMEALAAVLTADFGQSRWCDQEVGIALGQGKLVIPIKVDIDPYGFLAKHQALHASRDALAEASTDIVRILINHPSTTVSMTNALVTAFAEASNFATAKILIGLLETLPNVSKDHATIIARALKANRQVYDAWGVPERTKGLLNRHGYKRLAG